MAQQNSSRIFCHYMKILVSSLGDISNHQDVHFQMGGSPRYWNLGDCHPCDLGQDFYVTCPSKPTLQFSSLTPSAFQIRVWLPLHWVQSGDGSGQEETFLMTFVTLDYLRRGWDIYAKQRSDFKTEERKDPLLGMHKSEALFQDLCWAVAFFFFLSSMSFILFVSCFRQYWLHVAI